MELRDWPDFAVRGYMLDVSRDRVPTRDTLERLIGLCALARINQLQLYTEHTFAFRDHEQVWEHASPLTADDIRWLDDRCDEAGIELVPNLNCFGHMERWLRHDRYRGRAEAPEGITVMPGLVLPPSVLAPTQSNADFALELFAEFLPNFRSRQVNINCDETFDLGHGASRQLVERDGRQRVFVDHLKRILEPLVAGGYRPQFWADGLRDAPTLARELPTEATPVCWTYEAPNSQVAGFEVEPRVKQAASALGIDLDVVGGFTHNTAPFVETGIPFWVAPGTSSWNCLIGRVDNATANLLDASDVGRSHASQGYLITDWGDDGHLQPPSISFGPIVLGGAVAWCRETNVGIDLATTLDRFVFGDPTGALGTAVVELGLQWARTGQRTFNSSPLHTALVSGRFGFISGEPDGALVTEVLQRLDQCAAAIAGATPSCSDAVIVRDELIQAARLARHGAWRLLHRAGGAAPEVTALRSDLAEAIEVQRDVWLRRSRLGGLEDSLAGLHARLARYTTQIG